MTLYALLLTPLLLADARLLCAVVGVLMLQCSLEAITGRHRFLQALHPGALLAVCATESDGAPKAALVCAVWLCSAATEARLGAASRALGRPVRAWHDLPQLLRLAVAGSTRAERALAGVGLALAAAGLVLGGPDAMLRWLANLLLALWGGSVGMRVAAASLLQARLVFAFAVLHRLTACAARPQLSLDTRGKNVIAAAGCRALLATSMLSALYLLRRCT